MKVFARALPVFALAACGGASPTPDAPESTEAFLEHGAAIYEVAGCGGCHGSADGSTLPTEGWPSLHSFVSRFGLTVDTRGTAIDWIHTGALHDRSRDSSLPFEGFEQFVITARLYEGLVAGGGHDGLFEHMRFEEPMPAWGETLSQRDIDAVLAYLISLDLE